MGVTQHFNLILSLVILFSSYVLTTNSKGIRWYHLEYQTKRSNTNYTAASTSHVNFRSSFIFVIMKGHDGWSRGRTGIILARSRPTQRTPCGSDALLLNVRHYCSRSSHFRRRSFEIDIRRYLWNYGCSELQAQKEKKRVLATLDPINSFSLASVHFSISTDPSCWCNSNCNL